MAGTDIRSGIAALAAFIRAHDDFAVLGHVSPDGDAAGSCLALKLALDDLGKRAFVALPGGLPLRYAFLPDGESVLDPADAPPFAPKAAIAVDVADMARLGSGAALFEATHGTAPDIAGRDIVNPCSNLLSGVMMLEHLGWDEAGALVTAALERSFSAGYATADLARLMNDGKPLGTRAFTDHILSLL